MLPLDEANDIINDETASMLEMEELNLLVQEAIYALPDKCQKVFRLSREGSKTNQEIANEMNVSVKTVEAQITKALKRIKNFLDDKYAYLF